MVEEILDQIEKEFAEKQDLISLLHFLLVSRGEKRLEAYRLLEKYDPIDVILCSIDEYLKYGNHDRIGIVDIFFYRLTKEEDFEKIISVFKDCAIINAIDNIETLSTESKIRLLKKFLFIKDHYDSFETSTMAFDHLCNLGWRGE